jgi:hypothetical protein
MTCRETSSPYRLNRIAKFVEPFASTIAGPNRHRAAIRRALKTTRTGSRENNVKKVHFVGASLLALGM